jgi:predicted transcriptional regulator
MKFNKHPTERELEILKILWDKRSATVRDVYKAMRQHEDIAQNTVQTFLRMMESKGLVSHDLDGRAFVYRPLHSRRKVLSRFLNRIFDGAVDQLVLNAVEVAELSAREIEELEKKLRAARRGQRASTLP